MTLPSTNAVPEPISKEDSTSKDANANNSTSNSNSFIGTWQEEIIDDSHGLKSTFVNKFLFEENGNGKFTEKTIFVNDNADIGNSRTIIEYPFTWRTGQDKNRDILIREYGVGKIIEIEAKDKVKEEQQAISRMNMLKHGIDTLYFEFKSSTTIKYHISGTNDELELNKVQ